MIEPTLIQFAALVIVLKLSGYSQSVDGHGKQQLSPSAFEQNRPSTTMNELGPFLFKSNRIGVFSVGR